MAQITFTMSASDLNRIVDAIGYDYEPLLEDGTSNPQTKPQYARAKLIEFLKISVRQYEHELAKKAVVVPRDPDVT